MTVRPFLLDMVKVPAGTFIMGSDRDGKAERPAHRVQLTHSFYIDRTEVRAAEYSACANVKECSTRRVHTADDPSASRWRDSKRSMKRWRTRVLLPKLVGHFFVVSQFARDELIRCGASPAHITCLYNPIDTQRFQPNPVARRKQPRARNLFVSLRCEVDPEQVPELAQTQELPIDSQ